MPTSDITQADADSFLDTVLLPLTGAFSVPVRDSSGLETSAAATETSSGILPIATQVLTDAGVDDASIITPLKLTNFSGLGGGGGADLWAAFDANDATFPSSNPAAANSRNGHPLLAFDDTTAENVIFHDSMSNDYSAGNITVDIDWVAASATTGGVTWGVEFERIAAGGHDIDADSFDTQQTETSTTNGTSGIVTRTSIVLTQAQADSIAAGDAFRLRAQRVTGDGGDDMSGDAQILRVIGRQ